MTWSPRFSEAALNCARFAKPFRMRLIICRPQSRRSEGCPEKGNCLEDLIRLLPVMEDSEMTQTTLSHLDDLGQAHMVDVGDKPITRREAKAEGYIRMNSATLQAIADSALPKGEVFGAARV